MSTESQSEPPMHQLPETAENVAATAMDLAPVVQHATKRTIHAAKDIYHSAAEKAGDTLAVSKECVRRNPVRVVLGAVAIGVALGYLVSAARRQPPFTKRNTDGPILAMREAVVGAFAPVAQRVHEGYHAAVNGAGKIKHRAQRLHSRSHGTSFAAKVGRIGNHLKFW